MSSRTSKIAVVQLGKQNVSLGKFKRCILYIYYIFIFVMFKNARMPFKKIKKKETSIAVM